MVRRSASRLPPHPRRSGAVAQLGERCNRTAEVTGSIPVSSIAASGTNTAPRCDKLQAQFSPTKFCPPLFDRTQSSNDGARGSSGETVARNLNATSTLVAFSISVPVFPPVLPRPRRANARRGREYPPEVRRIRRAGSGLPPSRPSRSNLRPRATRATRRSA